jgi:cation:H+ antiporter
MSAGGWLLVFGAAVVVSLAASWLLVSRLERLAERAGFSEAWLGVVAAFAADAPEITSAVTALVRGQASVGAGVVVGSNVFNLAALLGLSAVVAGRIAFHRRVVLLGGVPGVWIAAVCLVTVAGVVRPWAGLVLAAVVLVPYGVLLGLRQARLEGLRLPARWRAWLVAAVHDEEAELTAAIRPEPGTWRDGLMAIAGLVLWLEEHEHLPPHEIATALEQRSGSGWPTSASPSTTTKTITPTMTTTSPQPRRPHAPW